MKNFNRNLKISCKRFLYILFIISLLIIDTSAWDGHDLVKGNLIQFNDNGAWCWHQDELAVIDVEGGKLIVGSDANGISVGGSPRNGDTLKKDDHVILKVYNILGKEVAAIINERKPAGTYKENWDPQKLSSGIYICRLVIGNYSRTNRMMFIK